MLIKGCSILVFKQETFQINFEIIMTLETNLAIKYQIEIKIGLFQIGQ